MSEVLVHNKTQIPFSLFCKLLRIDSSQVNVASKRDYMLAAIREKNVNIDKLAAAVEAAKENMRRARRARYAANKETIKDERHDFEHQYSPRNISKDRSCLRCDVVFLSTHGNRVCYSCNEINKYMGNDGIAE